MARIPHSEHARHGAYARTTRSKHLQGWLKLRASVLTITPPAVYALLQQKGATLVQNQQPPAPG